MTRAWVGTGTKGQFRVTRTCVDTGTTGASPSDQGIGGHGDMWAHSSGRIMCGHGYMGAISSGKDMVGHGDKERLTRICMKPNMIRQILLTNEPNQLSSTCDLSNRGVLCCLSIHIFI